MFVCAAAKKTSDLAVADMTTQWGPICLVELESLPLALNCRACSDSPARYILQNQPFLFKRAVIRVSFTFLVFCGTKIHLRGHLEHYILPKVMANQQVNFSHFKMLVQRHLNVSIVFGCIYNEQDLVSQALDTVTTFLILVHQ